MSRTDAMRESEGEMFYGPQTYPKDRPFYLKAGMQIRLLSRQAADLRKGIIATDLDAKELSTKAIKKRQRKVSGPNPARKANTSAAPRVKAKPAK